MPEAGNYEFVSVRTLSALKDPPEFRPNDPWRLAARANKPYWWRIDEGGTVWRVDVATGRLTWY